MPAVLEASESKRKVKKGEKGEERRGAKTTQENLRAAAEFICGKGKTFGGVQRRSDKLGTLSALLGMKAGSSRCQGGENGSLEQCGGEKTGGILDMP